MQSIKGLWKNLSAKQRKVVESSVLLTVVVIVTGSVTVGTIYASKPPQQLAKVCIGVG